MGRLTRGLRASENRWKTCLHCRTWRVERGRKFQEQEGRGKQTEILKTYSVFRQSLGPRWPALFSLHLVCWLALALPSVPRPLILARDVFLGRPQPHETANSPQQRHWPGRPTSATDAFQQLQKVQRPHNRSGDRINALLNGSPTKDCVDWCELNTSCDMCWIF